MKTRPWTREEALEMHELYLSGMTLEQCGKRHGITRERVRQVFRKAGLPKRTPEQNKALRRLDAAVAAQAVHLYQGSGDITAVARALGVTQEAVREAVREALPQFSVFRPATKPKPRFTDEELLGLLREVSREVGGVISVQDYDTYSAERTTSDGRPWPTYQTPQHRFGSWRDALLRAGLNANASSPIRGQRIFDAGHCIDGIRQLARELGAVPTARQYEEFAAQSGGSVPSLSIVQLRCGSWHLAAKAALRDFGWALRQDPGEDAV